MDTPLDDVHFDFLLNYIHPFNGPVSWGIDTVPISRPLDLIPTKVIAVFSSINGYHVYRVKPPVGCPLLLAPEPDNVYDRHALVVSIPTAMTKDARVFHPQVSEILGRRVGRVPGALTPVLTPAMDAGVIKSITVFYTGGMMHDGPVRGGGPKLAACYVLHTTPDTHSAIGRQLHEAGICTNDLYM